MADDKKDDIKTNDTENVVDDGTKKPEENDKVENGEKVDEKVPTETRRTGRRKILHQKFKTLNHKVTE